MRVLLTVFLVSIAFAATSVEAAPITAKPGPADIGATLPIEPMAQGCGWGWHPVPGHWSQWRGGWVPPHCAPNREGGGWGGPYGGQGNPYRGWGGYGGGQGAYGGWGNNGGGWGNP